MAGSFNPNVGPPPALSVVRAGPFRGLTGGLAVTNTASGGNVFTSRCVVDTNTMFLLGRSSALSTVEDNGGPCPPDIGAGLKNESPATAGLSHEAGDHLAPAQGAHLAKSEPAIGAGRP